MENLGLAHKRGVCQVSVVAKRKKLTLNQNVSKSENQQVSLFCFDLMNAAGQD
eukprot:m.451282 g.451282  ORF g.451282 m.451282 type:complete len:53 (+) comp56915_c0_seq6:386-544(+)